MLVKGIKEMSLNTFRGYISDWAGILEFFIVSLTSESDLKLDRGSFQSSSSSLASKKEQSKVRHSRA